MSELLTSADAIAAFLSSAALSMGAAVATTARDEVAQSVVARGRTFLDVVLRRPRGDDEDTATAAAGAIAGLPEEARGALETAVGQWLAGGELGADALRGHIERAAAGARQGGGAHAYGKHAVAVETVQGDFTINFDGDPQSGR
ncbi:hypothetical protein [Streptomyces sp. NPDC047525]|uniref:hypothetical protein n=1 Tax=Streptomyces sp. NPDC047525 TaxID=3155264 RepID=UPI003407B504